MKVFLTLLVVAAALAANETWGQAPPDLLKQGQEVYDNNCADCHRTNGEGLPVKFPALKGNAFVLGDPGPVLDTVVNGRIGKKGQMPAWKERFRAGLPASGRRALGFRGIHGSSPPYFGR